ncbi:MAG: hypothetical protein ACJA01_003862, partial [Saprospiraceae bacterium]
TINIKEIETLTSITDTQGSGKVIGTYNDEDGSATDIVESVTTVHDTLTSGGNKIATYTNEDGDDFGIHETVTTLDTSGTNLIYTDEAGAFSTIDMYSANRIAEIYDVAGAQGLGTSFGNINFATAGIIDPGFGSSANSITINTSGRYRVTYRVTTQVINNTRTGAEFNLTNGALVINGTYAASYQRNKDVDRNTIAVTKMLDLAAGAVISVQGRRYSSTGTIRTVANGSSLLIERIK